MPDTEPRGLRAEAALGEIVHERGEAADCGWFIVGPGGYFDVDNAQWCVSEDGDAPWTSEWFDLFGTVSDLIADSLGRAVHYADRATAPLALTPADQQRVADLLDAAEPQPEPTPLRSSMGDRDDDPNSTHQRAHDDHAHDEPGTGGGPRAAAYAIRQLAKGRTGHPRRSGTRHAMLAAAAWLDTLPPEYDSPQPAPEVVQDDGEALALAEEIWLDEPTAAELDLVRLFLASGWLARRDAQRDAEVAATARREGAQAVIDAVEDACCADPSWLTDGEESRVAAFAVVRAAHDAAARLRATGRAM